MPDYPALEEYESLRTEALYNRVVRQALNDADDRMRDELLARIKALEAELACWRADAEIGAFKDERDSWMRACKKAEAELAAEREKRCGTCGNRVWLGWRWTCPHLQAVVSASTEDAVEVPDDFGCTEYEPAEQGGKS